MYYVRWQRRDNAAHCTQHTYMGDAATHAKWAPKTAQCIKRNCLRFIPGHIKKIHRSFTTNVARLWSFAGIVSRQCVGGLKTSLCWCAVQWRARANNVSSHIIISCELFRIVFGAMTMTLCALYNAGVCSWVYMRAMIMMPKQHFSLYICSRKTHLCAIDGKDDKLPTTAPL